MADKVLVTFSMRDGSSAPDAVIAAADRYVAGLDPALAVPMNTGIRADSVARDFARLARMHWLLILGALIAVAGAVGGSHGLF